MQLFSELSPEIQGLVFDKAKHLRKSGFGYKRTIKAILSEFDARLPQSTLVYWCKNNVKLLGRENQFNPKPTPELSYVLGTCFGDACARFDKRTYDYNIALEVIDLDFAEKFSKCISKVLGKERNYSICKTPDRTYSTKARSKKLYYFIKSVKEDFEKAKPIIEEFPAEFIQGLADSEGCPAISAVKRFTLRIIVANSVNQPLLEFVQKLLLRRFGIYSILRLSKTAGMSDSVIEGRVIFRTKDIFSLEINRRNDIKKYLSEVGFSAFRKQGKFIDAVALLGKNKEYCLVWWNSNYIKGKKEWVKRANKFAPTLDSP